MERADLSQGRGGRLLITGTAAAKPGAVRCPPQEHHVRHQQRQLPRDFLHDGDPPGDFPRRQRGEVIPVDEHSSPLCLQ
ncbi:MULTISPECIES: hypothetical protein [unclassified Arthrobacter]|uniref:hypothetical protein n=1 Tax=unclassified Arthrobacter TaxID=235627 RepID=UPI000CE4C686|nr:MULTISPECIES: hypothetical protein [unclassified Arthrobacter]